MTKGFKIKKYVTNVKNVTGFTLIEVMFVVAIIGILVAVALPAYGEYIKRGRITEALAQLADMQPRMEQYFQDHRKYTGACADQTVAPKPADTSYFRYGCAVTDDSYAITADGHNVMQGFTFKLELKNGVIKRSTPSVPSGWATPDPNNCWIRNKGGIC